MAWANVANVTNTHLNAATDDPSQARAELNASTLELQNVINGRGTSNGVASLDATTKVPSSQLPDELNSSSGQDLTLDPNTDRVAIENIINLFPLTVTQVNAIGSPAEGDVAYTTNGDAGAKSIAVYDGTNWKVVALGATISAT
tara:strand:+ start:4857 stop:5288 length:432 start_codon:yes stop_codon:yes gene_type:complete